MYSKQVDRAANCKRTFGSQTRFGNVMWPHMSVGFVNSLGDHDHKL